MTQTLLDLESWPRAAQFRFFKGFAQPHYAITVRIDASHLMARCKAAGLSPYRACLFAIASGLHGVPELMTRFRGDTVVRHDRIALSMPVPREDGGFNYAYVPFDPDFARFDAAARTIIEQTGKRATLGGNDGSQDDVAYLSCLPWLDFTALDNAMPGPDDCIPRIAWGKIVPKGAGFDMAMAAQVHHALVDGAHLGAFFERVQDALNRL